MSPASNNNTTSPAKRPGLGRRSVSSHAVISTRTSPASATDAIEPPKAAAGHKARAHVVGGGGGHRAHGRNPSFGKNLNKLQRLHSAQNVQLLTESATIGTGARHHQRKKSAPVTPAESPRNSGAHIRWDETNASLGDRKANAASIRKNFSTPSLHRPPSGVLTKKSLVTDRPQSAKGRPKKSVGFELAGTSDSEAEWEEDSTQSPESTRRGSVAPSAKDSAENSQVLVDPLIFVKRPYPQIQARSLPESIISTFPRDKESLENEDSESARQSSVSSNEQIQPMHAHEPDGIASRLLSSSRTSKAPPAMSSISAIGTATAVDAARRNESLTNLASSHVATRHAPSTSLTAETQTAPRATPRATPQATSSSIEGGVSRFITNDQAGAHAASRTDSDPNTPSSFLPHYHPQTPPSPGRNSSKKAKATSPQPRPPGDGPPSRTQQKLWLQRTATLTTSPPDSHGSPAIPPSTIDPVFMAASHSRTGQYENGRGAVNGSVRVGATHDSEAKHTRKAYEKTSSEINVVRRFQNPTKNSFNRIQRLANDTGRPSSKSEPNSDLAGKSVKSAPSLTNGKFLQTPSNRRPRAPVGDADNGAESESRHTAAKPGRVYFQEHDDVVNIADPAEPTDRLAIENNVDSQGQRSAQHIITASMNSGDREGDGYFASEQEMLLRRIWESRGEIASPG